MTNNKRKWIVLSIVTVVVAVLLSPFASPHPDGLERVAEDHGFIGKADAGFSLSPFPDYAVNLPFADTWKAALAGLIGIGIIAAVLWAIGKILTSKRDRRV